jgi:WhiB family redox-sensing transcriptional regulator
MSTLSAYTLARPADTRGHDRGVNWRDSAECRDAEPTIFEPDDGGTPDDLAWTHARSICRACPVRDACLDDALTVESPGQLRFGMRGGLTPDERERYARRRARAAALGRRTR